nr:MAG TPA: hypothetical protein [Caudoviricetes sp.]DAZ84299.1 MAG TPA: hypothetical protein [Caudoviricetes sp.]
MIFTSFFKAIPLRDGFSICPLTWGGKERMWASSTTKASRSTSVHIGISAGR